MNKNYIASVVENIVTLIITFLFCKYISLWGLLLLLNLNTRKIIKLIRKKVYKYGV